jgi:hypothetical protein
MMFMEIEKLQYDVPATTHQGAVPAIKKNLKCPMATPKGFEEKNKKSLPEITYIGKWPIHLPHQ